MDSLPDDKNVRMLCLYDNEEVIIISQCIVLTTCTSVCKTDHNESRALYISTS